MFRKNLVSALGVGLGITLGNVIIPHFFFFQNMFVQQPPLFKHMTLCFVSAYLTSLAMFFLFDVGKRVQQKMKQF